MTLRELRHPRSGSHNLAKRFMDTIHGSVTADEARRGMALALLPDAGCAR
jgi:hypothetical protein